MPSQLLLVLAIGSIMLVSVVFAAVMAGRLGTAIRVLAAILLIPLACFCLFGFAASFEPGDFHLAWRAMYAIVFFACLIALARLAMVKREPSGMEQD